MGDISTIYGQDFDTQRDDAATGGYEALPPGWYTCQIEKAEVRNTKAGTGKLLSVEFIVVDGERKGAVIFTNINLINPSPKATEIGVRELAGLGQGCGLTVISDTAELVGKLCECRVKIEQQEGFEPSNKVVGYRRPGGTPAAPPQKAATPPQKAAAVKTPSTAPSAAKRPWER